MEEENKNIWNKKMDELTVKDAVVINLAIPAIAVGGIVAIGAAVNGYNAASSKFRKFKSNRQNKNLEIVKE